MAIVKISEKRAGVGTTTDASTQIALATFDTSTAGPGGVALDNCSIFITGSCTGFNTGGGTGAGEFLGAEFKIVSGTLTQVSTSTHAIAMIKDTGGAPNSEFSVAGSIITYYVTGVAATTIDWFGQIDILVYQPA